MIKLVATDIDGTILKHDFKFNPEVKSCIKKLQKNGIKVVLVTGRMFEATKSIADELGLTTPVVSYQGGLIKETQNQKNILYERYLAKGYAEQIIKWGKENNVHLNLYSDDKLYSETDCEIIKRYSEERYTTYQVKPFCEISLERVNKILAIDFNDANRVDSWVKPMQEKFPEIYIVKSTPYFCEFSHKEAKKSCAVEFLQSYWNLDKSEILTIGDQDNDIELLKAGGIKVALGNGTIGLKEIADYITDSVENDGFVKAIEKFVL